MKQKEIVIDSKLGSESVKMIRMYFAVKNVNGIEGFVYSEEEFLKKYKNSYMINDFRSARSYAIYQVNHCENCRQSYEVIISSRSGLLSHLQTTIRICNPCLSFQSSTENILGYKLL
ncbi:hypothetical protein [Salegentibacter mishustinae]|uniref:hypothetical protein n=1 Tax=Salegentibacter mishustinae TaxID=270918 RepID=UPI002491C044|nr:hypothetical protein [Salegentibacter mishustinae]